MKFLALAAVASAQMSMENIASMITVTVDKKLEGALKAHDAQNKAWGESLKTDPVMAHVGQTAEAWGNTPQVQQLEAFDNQVNHSPLGQKLQMQIQQAVGSTVAQVQHSETPTHATFHVNNAPNPAVEAQWKAVETTWKAGEAQYGQQYEAKTAAALKTQQFANLHQALEAFKNKHGQAIDQEIDWIKATIKAHTQVTDIPQH
jgi:hypothetical protein